MTQKIEVYDPAMCCSTGVCGSEVDPRLVQFASDLAWLAEQGVSVARFNLAQQPAAFAANPVVKEALQSHGNACLPLVLVEGAIATRSIYPTRDQLAALAGVADAGCCCGGHNEADEEQSEEGCCGSQSGESSGCCC